jgi:hypothetical protein
LDIVTLAIILDIKQYTANLMDNAIGEMTKDIKTLSTMQRRETITHFLPCKAPIMNSKNATNMVTKPVNVDCQNMIKG